MSKTETKKVFAKNYCCMHALPLGWSIEQWAAVVLGYTQASWDNKSGKEKQPSSSKKYWNELTARERAAALNLGYTQWMWDGGDVPASVNKNWAELTACGECVIE